MKDAKQLMRHHYLKYASYVILDRAIPNAIDGLKPVQRRILHTLWKMNDGKLHKVVNVAGQTMAFHPHGDAPITEAMINMANKEYLLDRQGNFGNILTGDPAAAGRYIETRLSQLAIATMFNPDLTQTIPSYDGRHQEPVCLPAKLPILLMQGAEGIAVGMSTYILPHNFVELLEAEIAILKNESFLILPDFPTGGFMDATGYNKGLGKVKLRVKFDITDPKTVVIREICYGSTTESLIRSIDEAAKKGKIKIDAIHDYTSDKVEIEIKLPRGHYSQDLIDALYLYTECEVTLTPQMVSIKDDLPWECTVDDILHLNVSKLQEYLQMELEIENGRLLEKIFERNLERIFIENRLYKPIEFIAEYDLIHASVEKGLTPFYPQLSREPTYDDREKLLNIPIRRISRFNIDKNETEITALQQELSKVQKHLQNIKKFTINYLQALITKYGKDYPRQTVIQSIGEVNWRAIETRNVKVGFDPATGFVGTNVATGSSFECTNFDKILLIYKDGSYKVINMPEKQYVDQKDNKIVYVGAADKKSVISVVYKDPVKRLCYAKRFVIEKFILDKLYRYLEQNMELQFISTQPDPSLELIFVPKAKQKTAKASFPFSSLLVKGVSAKGIKMSPREIKKIMVLQG
ncbi:MAG: DNA topoisomerase IV subunit A [Parachlamydiaceae bacterium]|nr:DNA topoisomerase IV subunit A [Parachlamydiaceae bacterium]